MGHGCVGLEAGGQNTPERWTGVGFVVEIAGLDADVTGAVELDGIVERISCRGVPGPLPSQPLRPAGPSRSSWARGASGPRCSGRSGRASGPGHSGWPYRTSGSSRAYLGERVPERRTAIRLMVEIARLDADVTGAVELDGIVERISCRGAPGPLPSQPLRSGGPSRSSRSRGASGPRCSGRSGRARDPGHSGWAYRTSGSLRSHL